MEFAGVMRVPRQSGQRQACQGSLDFPLRFDKRSASLPVEAQGEQEWRSRPSIFRKALWTC